MNQIEVRETCSSGWVYPVKWVRVWYSKISVTLAKKLDETGYAADVVLL